MFESLLDRSLRQGLRSGALEIVYPSGRRGRYGDGTGPEIRVRVADAATLRAIALYPQLAVGEAYMDGRLVLEAGDVYQMIEFARTGVASERLTPFARVAERLRGIAASSPASAPNARGATRRTTTTSTRASTVSSSTPTCSTPAPSSRRRT